MSVTVVLQDGNKSFRLRSACDPEKMLSDNALISVTNIGDRYYALCETPYMVEINPDTLETLDIVSISN